MSSSFGYWPYYAQYHAKMMRVRSHKLLLMVIAGMIRTIEAFTQMIETFIGRFLASSTNQRTYRTRRMRMAPAVRYVSNGTSGPNQSRRSRHKRFTA